MSYYERRIRRGQLITIRVVILVGNNNRIILAPWGAGVRLRAVWLDSSARSRSRDRAPITDEGCGRIFLFFVIREEYDGLVETIPWFLNTIRTKDHLLTSCNIIGSDQSPVLHNPHLVMH